jgi:hypothetical protein
VPTDIFLPPLQGKYELLKKAVGVENEFDENASEQGLGDAGNYRVTRHGTRRTLMLWNA